MRLILSFVFILLNAYLFAQNNGELKNKWKMYNDTSIVWATYFEVDVIPDLTEKEILEKHCEGMNEDALTNSQKFFKTYRETTKSQTLNQLIFENINSIKLFTTENNSPINRNHKLFLERKETSDLRSTNWAEFEVFRLKGILYYDKQRHRFFAIPEAIGLQENSFGDLNAIWGYDIKAWIPLDTTILESSTSWHKTIVGSISLDDLYIFKQEWNSDEIFLDQTEYLRKNYKKVNVQSPVEKDNNEQPIYLNPNEIKRIATSKEMILNEKTNNYDVDYYPISWSIFEGLQLTMTWKWDKQNKKVNVNMINYAPYGEVDGDEIELVDKKLFYKLNFDE